MRLRCTNCDASFEGERDGRCPKCLRRTSVVQTMDSTAPPRDGTPAPWPDGTRCPLCLAQDVSAATFHFEIEKRAGVGVAVGAGAGAGAVDAARWVTVRCRCCDACRRRVMNLGRLRAAVLPLVALGTVAWPLSVVSSLPMRMLGLSRLESVMLTALFCAVLVGIPLVFVDRANRSLRRNLETSWLFRRVRARVQHVAPVAPEAGENVPNDHWKLLAEPSSSAVVIEATELLRS